MERVPLLITGAESTSPEPTALVRPPQHIARIAHRAGNDRDALSKAIEARVDWIEVDLWYAWGRLVARHERGVWRLPVVYDKWHVRLLHERLLDLDALIERTAGGPNLFLDLKGTSSRLPDAIVRTLQRHGACERAAVCGQYWPPLDAVVAAEPRIRVFHSLGRPEHVVQHLRRLERDTVSHGVSAAHWLLTPEIVGRLRQDGRQLFAWTVNDESRASTLVEWGADGVISDRLDLLAGLP
ncbi:MAG TPA: glycerophosphodiester phosphodiesterase [Dehalococcoidia bacterium]|nr:glycerophosphodiester phosphodiesterase [Dehalococcoidia bacterium]